MSHAAVNLEKVDDVEVERAYFYHARAKLKPLSIEPGQAQACFELELCTNKILNSGLKPY